uniref:ShKT domain-containing protein n=1 Tax=Meloidogyne floridensis TaxID=298350 RepID=A0A915PDV8_9BILA
MKHYNCTFSVLCSLNSFFLGFGSFNVLDGQPSELLAFAQVPPILPQNSQKSPNLQLNKENPLIPENSEGTERQFVPLVVNGHRLVNNPTNPIFVRVVPNNQSKVNEIAKQDDDQRTNIKFAPNGDEIKEKITFEKKKEENTNPFSSLGSSTIEVKPAFNTKKEKQLQGKNEEKSKINTKVDTKPFILKNEENKLEEKKREKKKEGGNSNNKLFKEGKDDREKSEIPEETNRENNKKEEDKKGNTNKEEQKFPENFNIKKNEKRGENKEKGKNKGNDLLIETWKNKIPFEGVKNWNKENEVEKTNKFTPWNELSLLPILLQTAFEEFKIALEKERQQNNFLKFKLKRNYKNRKESNKEGLNKGENECVDLAENCLENNIFCGIKPYQELMKENCDCTCKIYLNKKKEEKIKSGENEEEIGSSEEEASSEGENSEEENSLEEAKESEDDKDIIKKNECSDKSFRCGRWAKRGFCENRLFNNDLKKRICASSCNLC